MSTPQGPYSIGLDKTPANFVPLSPLSFLERTANMFRAACDLAAAMNLRVVAEGIETVDELTVCKEAGCHLVQGWFVGKPVKPEGFGVLVASWMVKAAGRAW